MIKVRSLERAEWKATLPRERAEFSVMASPTPEKYLRVFVGNLGLLTEYLLLPTISTSPRRCVSVFGTVCLTSLRILRHYVPRNRGPTLTPSFSRRIRLRVLHPGFL